MKLVSFCILTGLSVLYLGLTVAETMTYHKWEQAAIDQKYIQAQIAFFDHLNQVLTELVQRMAIDSQRDPALAQLLKDHNINVVIKDTSKHNTAGFNVPAPANPAVQSPGNPPPALAPSDSNAIHP